MKKALAAFVLITLFSCSNKPGEVQLFNHVSFLLKKGETVVPLTANARAEYGKYCNNRKGIQVPLLKRVKHENYTIFIGVPFNTSVRDLNNSLKDDTLSITVENDSSYYFRKYFRDSLYISEYATVFPGNSFIYISGITASKAISDSLFNKEGIISRMKVSIK